MLTEAIDYLNKNSGALTVLFTGVVTISTVAYAVLTWKLVSETRRMREVQTEPKIEITLKPLEFAINIVRLHIRNIGLGPAVNVKFMPQVISGGDVAKALLDDFTEPNFFKTGIAYLGPKQELLSGYTQMNKDTDAKLEAILDFNLEYNGATEKKYTDKITIDMSQHEGMHQLGIPHLYSIAQSLKKLEAEFSHVVSGFKKVNANIYTAEDRERENKERLEALKKRRKEKPNS